MVPGWPSEDIAEELGRYTKRTEIQQSSTEDRRIRDGSMQITSPHGEVTSEAAGEGCFVYQVSVPLNPRPFAQ
jgi:hypothetical protein